MKTIIARVALGATALIGLMIPPVLMASAASAAAANGGAYVCTGATSLPVPTSR